MSFNIETHFLLYLITENNGWQNRTTMSQVTVGEMREIAEPYLPENYEKLGFVDKLRSLDSWSEECARLHDNAKKLIDFRRGCHLIDTHFPGLSPSVPNSLLHNLGYLALSHSPIEDTKELFRSVVPEEVIYRLKVRATASEAYDFKAMYQGPVHNLNGVEGELCGVHVGSILKEGLPRKAYLSIVCANQMLKDTVHYAVPAANIDMQIMDQKLLDKLKEVGFKE